jgi:hypothetical protein
MAYTWVTRFRYSVFPHPSTPRPPSLPPHLSDVLDNPAIHAAFIILFVVAMLALLCTTFCNPGIVCATKTKGSLKPVRAIEQIPPNFFYEKPRCIPDFHIDCRRPRPGKPLKNTRLLYRMLGWLAALLTAKFALTLHLDWQVVKLPHTKHCSTCNNCVTVVNCFPFRAMDV